MRESLPDVQRIEKSREGKERRSGYDRRKGQDRRAKSDRMGESALLENAYEPGVNQTKKVSPHLADFIRWMPKVELHMHLEGCIRASTANALIKRNHPGHKTLGNAGILKLYRFNSLSDFVYSMGKVSDNLKSPQDLARVAQETFSALIAQNVRYVEFDCALSKYLKLGYPLNVIVDAIKEVVSGLETEYDFKAKMLANIIRHHGPETARSLVEQLIDLSDDFIVGIGLSGDEKAFPAPMFKDTFDLARKAGLKITVHAGEDDGPVSVWDALNTLNAHRIDHGIRSMDDESLVRYLKKHNIPVTQCLTSNLRLGLVDSLDDHPFRSFYDQGLTVSLHTDDPEIFHVSLTSEFALAASQFELGAEDIEKIVMNSVVSSFLPDDQKAEMASDIRDEFHYLRGELFL